MKSFCIYIFDKAIDLLRRFLSSPCTILYNMVDNNGHNNLSLFTSFIMLLI